MKKHDIRQEARRTLEMLDQLQRVESNPYLNTRILARWQREQESSVKISNAWKWQLALVAVLLLINLWTILPKWVNTDARTDYLNSLADDYGINNTDASIYNYSQLN